MDPVGFYQAVGRRIKAAREKAGFTQEVLATRLSLTRTSVTNIEKGRQKLLLHTFCSIADVLGTNVPALLPELSSSTEMPLEDLLKGRPRTERDWISSITSSSKKER